MKIISRDFTAREKFLLLVLSILIIVLLYYNLVDAPVRNGLGLANAERDALTVQVAAVNQRISNIEHMIDEIDQMRDSGRVVSKMPSYNAGKREINFLHTTLGLTQDYYIGFNDLSRNGDQIRRNFSLQYRTSNFNEAVEIMRSLEQSNIRCLIDDVTVTPMENRGNVMTGPVQVTCTATFYETMYGGKADAELPADAAEME